MEKSIHSHLFAALVSTKEQRLAFMAGPETPEAHDALEGQIDKDLKNPGKDQADIDARMAELQSSKFLVEGTNMKDFTDRFDKSRTRREEVVMLEKIRAMTSDADFKKIEDDVKKGDPKSAREKIAFALGQIDTFIAQSRPHNAVLQAQDYINLIAKIQALDTDKKLDLMSGAKVDATKLEGVKNFKNLTFAVGGKIATLTQAFNTPGIPSETKELAKKPLLEAIDERKEELWTEMPSLTGFSNSEKLVQELVDQIKNLNEKKNEINGVPAVVKATPAPAPAAAPAPAPATAPAATPTATPTATPAAAPTLAATPVEADKALKDSGVDTKLVDALTGAKDLDAQNTALEALNKDPKVEVALKGPDAVKFTDALNKKLESANPKMKVEVKDGKLQRGAPAEEKKAVEPPKEIKTKLDELLDFFKKLFEFLRDLDGKNVGIGALQGELGRIDDEIAKIKKDNPDFSKQPDIKKQIDDLLLERAETENKIAQGKKRGLEFVRDANTEAKRNGLGVTAALDRQGRPCLTPHTVPGVTFEESRGQVTYMTRLMQQEYPGVGVLQTAGVRQGVTFNFYGDVNINSKNKTDNSRVIKNTNNVSGKNNTVSASADGSQNGANAQEQFGGVGAALDGTAKNRATLRSQPTAPVFVEPIAEAPVVQPRRARIVDAPPPTGNLS